MTIKIESIICEWDSDTAAIIVKFINLLMLNKTRRELEIALFGKQVSMCKTRTHKSKKVYNRKKNKKITITD